MALDFQINISVVVLELVDKVLQALLGFRRELGTVRRKLHGIVRQNHGVKEFALGQFAGGLGAVHGVLGRLVELNQMGLVFVHLALSGLRLGVHCCYMFVLIIFGRT